MSPSTRATTTFLVLFLTACGKPDPGGQDGPGGPKADCATCSDVLANDALQRASQRESQRWLDANISSGSASMQAGRLDGAEPDDLKAAAIELLRSSFASDVEPLPVSATVSVTEPVEVFILDLQDGFLLETADRVATDGFSFAPENETDRAGIYWSLQHTIDWLATPQAEVAAAAEASAVVDVGGEPRRVTLTLVANTATGEFVAVYVREGTF
jgi:hypothetical protein